MRAGPRKVEPLKVGVVTVARSDYGIQRPLLAELHRRPAFCLQVIAGGMHLAPEFGLTLQEVAADPWPVAATVDMTLASDTAGSAARAMGLGLIGFAQAYESLRPDLLLVFGDRYEMMAAALAAVPFNIPLVHLSGGSVTEGAMDDCFRHAITKLAHLHFCEIEAYGDRLRQMGEADEAVKVVGALGLDSVLSLPPLSLEEVNQRFGLAFTQPPALVTFHPVSRQAGQALDQLEVLLAALDRWGGPWLITHPNADAEGRALIARIQDHCRDHPTAASVAHLGAQAYHSLMRLAPVMVGNSSSGIIEAASYRLPVVNVGDRQKNRLAPANVLHCPPEPAALSEALSRATDPTFRDGLADLINPYGDGCTAQRVADHLERLARHPLSPAKAFIDRPERLVP